MKATTIATALLLTACGSSSSAPLDEEGSQEVFEAWTEIQGDLMTEMYTGIGSPAKAIEFSTEPGRYTITGDLDGDGVRWDGTIFVDGEMTWPKEGGAYFYDLSLDYVDVHHIGRDVTLNGNVTYSMEMFTSQDPGQGMTWTYSVQGDLEISGARNGSVVFDFNVEATYSQDGYEITTTGDVNGHDVRGWHHPLFF